MDTPIKGMQIQSLEARSGTSNMRGVDAADRGY